MADKKKKNSKVIKQNKNKQQIQQVVVNVSTGRRASNKPRQSPPPPPPPPPPIVYRDNNPAFINSFLSDKTRENAITKLLLEHSQAEEKKKRPELAKPSVALYQPQPPNIPPPPNVFRGNPPDNNKMVRDLIINNNIHHSVKMPLEPTAPKKAEEFEAVINNKKMEEPLKEPKEPPNNLPPELPQLTGVRMNRRGLPDRRTREGRAMYEEMMKAQNTEQPPPMANAIIQAPQPPRPPPTATSASINSASVQPVNFEPNDDEEEEFVVSRIKRKPA